MNKKGISVQFKPSLIVVCFLVCIYHYLLLMDTVEVPVFESVDGFGVGRFLKGGFSLMIVSLSAEIIGGIRGVFLKYEHLIIFLLLRQGLTYYVAFAVQKLREIHFPLLLSAGIEDE